ncbi:hypothetical protein [Komagataeibacter oboediens]|uniref:hypothetical protein n=1 Tax=Komagataeibacter oboediens TaxID=65958 RepID=UPI0015E8796F|nr:hypothetical protein [Komagataeibacter oboediens]
MYDKPHQKSFRTVMQSDMVCRAVFATLVAIFSRQEKNDGKHLFSVIYPQHPTLEPDPKVFEQYQPVVIHPSLRRDGVNDDMDWYCPT